MATGKGPGGERNSAARSRAEVNLLRLARACGHTPDAAERVRSDAPEPGWRTLEAYARRMRELLAEVRRSDSPPPVSLLGEYERMLAAAASAADAARRRQDELPQPAGTIAEGAPVGVAGAEAANHTRNPALAAHARGLIGAPSMKPAVAASLPPSLADRRAALLGGGNQRVRMGKRGGAGGGHGAHLQDQLAADRAAHHRMQEELANMTGTLKRNVEAIQQTVQADNARLAAMDDDMAKGIDSIARINVLTDEQRRKNRNTTCLQCFAVLFVTLFFWGTFVLMRIFSKAPLLRQAALPSFNPPQLTHPGKILIECTTKNPTIYYTLDETPPSRSSPVFDAARPPMIGGAGETEVRVRAVCTSKAKGWADSDEASVKYTLTGVIAAKAKAAEERAARRQQQQQAKEVREREVAAAAARKAAAAAAAAEAARRARSEEESAARKVEADVARRRLEEEAAALARRSGGSLGSEDVTASTDESGRPRASDAREPPGTDALLRAQAGAPAADASAGAEGTLRAAHPGSGHRTHTHHDSTHTHQDSTHTHHDSTHEAPTSSVPSPPPAVPAAGGGRGEL